MRQRRKSSFGSGRVYPVCWRWEALREGGKWSREGATRARARHAARCHTQLGPQEGMTTLSLLFEPWRERL